MPNRLSRIGVLLAALLVPGILFAQAPSAVSNIRATVANGTVTVTWIPPGEQNISYYRVYYSSNSILENGGVYDDFEATPGPQTLYTLQYKPAGGALYVSVLAVNDQGVEGEIFVEEAVVVIPRQQDSNEPIAPTLQEQTNFVPPQQQQQPEQQLPGQETFTVATGREQRTPEQTTPDTPEQSVALPQWEELDLEGALHLLLTDVLSPTEVRLLFSGTPYVEPENAPQAFSIVDSEGEILPIESVYIDQETATVRTAEQVKGEQYTLQLSDPLRGIDGAPLHAENRSSTFQGHPDGKEKEVEEEPVQQMPAQTTGGAGISNLQLTTASLLNGTYIVTAKWDTSNPLGDLVYYSVRQSLDGGQTMSDPQLIAFGIGGLEIPNVQPGEYGIGVSAISAYGYATPEVFTSIQVGPQQPTIQTPVVTEPAVTAPQTEDQTEEPAPEQAPEETEPEEVIQTVGASRLSQSGAGVVLGSLGTMGMALGWRKTRRRQRK